ncbi:MAG: DUF6010 family protein [Parafilimonas sp.]
MTLALIIGITLGLISILFTGLLKQIDETIFYALLLAVIGALYVGYTWSDTPSFIINTIQCFFFGAIAYLGVKKSMYFLAAGFILHGAFDFVYSLFMSSDLLPPHYDWFCWSVDWVIGIYLFIIKYKQTKTITKKSRVSFIN